MDNYKLLQEFFWNNITKEILKADEIENEIMWEHYQELINQFYVYSSTDALGMWANIAGIEDNLYLDIDTRRSNVVAELRKRDITTVKVVKSISEAYAGGDCDVIENFADYSFLIRFTGLYGIPKRVEELRKALKRVIPAHLNFDFEYKFMIWNDFDRYNHSWDEWEGKNLTWDDIPTYHE